MLAFEDGWGSPGWGTLERWLGEPLQVGASLGQPRTPVLEVPSGAGAGMTKRGRERERERKRERDGNM